MATNSELEIKLIRDLIEAESAVWESLQMANWRFFRTANGPTKKSLFEEKQAVRRLFRALTGRFPDSDELSALLR